MTDRAPETAPPASPPVQAAGVEPAPPTTPHAQAVVDFASRFERARGMSWLGILAAASILAISLFVLWRILAATDVAAVRGALFATPFRALAVAMACAAASYLLLAGYDLLAMRELEVRIPLRTTLLGSFASYAVSFNLGFPILTGGTVRFWIYKPHGVSTGNIARLTVIAGLTFWLGMGAVIGLGLFLEADLLSAVTRGVLPIRLDRLVGLALLAAIGGYVFWVWLTRPWVRIQRWKLHLPGPRVTLGQMLLGAADVCAGAGVLYVLLPADLGLPFLSFAAIYAVACMIGIASHSPGGLGVFEATMLLALSWVPRETVLGALLLFRLLYYVLPFILALALLGATEMLRRIRADRPGGLA